MRFRSFFRDLFPSVVSCSRRGKKSAQRRPRARLILESLEKRIVPAVVGVNYDTATNTLTYIGHAGVDNVIVVAPAADTVVIDVSSGGDTIDFKINGGSPLLSGEGPNFKLDPALNKLSIDTNGGNAGSPASPIDQFTINLGDGDDQLNFSLASTPNGVTNVSIDGEAGNDAITFGTTTISGKLDVTADAISQTAATALTVPGTANFNAGAGPITLNEAGNDFVGVVTLGSGGDMSIQDANDLSLAGVSIASGKTLTLQAGGLIDQTGAFTGDGGITLNGSTLLMSQTGNNYRGDTTINGSGNVVSKASNVLSDNSTFNLATSSAFLNLNNQSDVIGGLSGRGTIQFTGLGLSNSLQVGNNNADTTFSGGINTASDTSDAFVKIGTGKLTFTGGLTGGFQGEFRVSGGVLNIQHAKSLGSSGGGTVVDAGAALEIQGAITVNESLTLNGGGIAPGNAGSLRSVLDNNTWSGSITLATDAAIGVDDNQLTVTGKITGSGKLTKVGPGVLVLNSTPGSNDYAGGTEIRSGTLQLGGSDQLPDTAVTVLAGATLDLNGKNDNIGGLTLEGGAATGSRVSGAGTLTLLGNVTVNDAATGTDAAVISTTTLSLDNATRTFNVAKHGTDVVLSVSAKISGIGAAGIIKDGPGIMVLSGANTYDGDTTINDGILRIKNTNALGSPVGVTIVNAGATNGVLELDGVSVANEALQLNGNGGVGTGALQNKAGNNSWGGPVTLNTDAEIGMDAGTILTIDGKISGAGSLTIQGTTGTLVLTNAANDYSGDTKVDEGTLQVDGKLLNSPQVILKFGTTLSGVGSVGAITSTTGGTISPGKAGTPTESLDSKTVSFSSTTSYNVELAGAAAGQFDQLKVSGAVDLGNANLDLSLLGGFVPAAGDKFYILDNDGSDAINGVFLQPTGALNEGAPVVINGYVFYISYQGDASKDGNKNDVVLTATGLKGFVVNTTGDQPDPSPLDGIADDVDPSTPGVQITLRSAIQSANSNPGTDLIVFNIPGGGPQTISVGKTLDITDKVVIDGYSQSGAIANSDADCDNAKLMVVVDGGGVGKAGTGLRFDAGSSGSVVRGLVLQNFQTADFKGSAINIANPVTGVQILGNFIGTDETGTASKANNWGVYVQGNNNQIGSPDLADRNVISGNKVSFNGFFVGNGVRIEGNSNKVQGNLIGLSADCAALGNGESGVQIFGNDNLVGGQSTKGEGNTIGDNGVGVGIQGDAADTRGRDNKIQGNLIGLADGGTKTIGNVVGVAIGQGSPVGKHNLIGGDSTNGEGNVISGNFNPMLGGTGIEIQGDDNTVYGNYIGTDVAGTGAKANITGISISGSNNIIGGSGQGHQNLISGNADAGVEITGFGGAPATGNKILGNYIGTKASGDSALANYDGIRINADADSNIVGGGAKGDGNVISGNSSSGVSILGNTNTVQGNIIGLDKAGSTAVANGNGVTIDGGTDNIIGGSKLSGLGNVISGNNNHGIQLQNAASGTLIQGNLIGSDVTGTVALGNSNGVQISDVTSNTVGGTTPDLGNLISGNRGNGVQIDNAGTTGNLIAGNLIGTDITGAVSLGVQNDGVLIQRGATGNTIGVNATGGAGNVISGNLGNGVRLQNSATTGNRVAGNFIGTDVTGTTAVANKGDGVKIDNRGNTSTSGNTIGGTSSKFRNVISGNLGNGVELLDGASLNLIQGNFIGTDVTGTTKIGNTKAGINLDNGASNNTIGGTLSSGALSAGNLISGNATGLSITGSSNASTGNQILGNFIGTDVTGAAKIANTNNGIDLGSGANNNTIGGSVVSGVLVTGNLISGNGGAGVFLSQANNNQIQGNFIGTDVTGATSGLGNNGVGVQVSNATGSIIGGSKLSGLGNVISGNNNHGIQLQSATSGTLIQGNLIGSDVTGTAALGNSNGVQISDVTSNTVGGATTDLGNLISGNRGNGVQIGNAGTTGNRIEGNLIGTDITGTVSLGVQNDGVLIQRGATGNTIGVSATGGARNIISGNNGNGVRFDGPSTTGNLLAGNYIGTNANGTGAVANGGDGVKMDTRGNTSTSGNTIGGTSSKFRNIISGNLGNGVELVDGASLNLVQGNFIGTDVTGTTKIGNTKAGISLDNGASNNTIGGALAAGNLISGNATGVSITGSSNGSTGNQILGNRIGTDVTGAAKIANNVGVSIGTNADNNLIGGDGTQGEGNIIAGNSNEGIVLSGSNNRVYGNLIGTNQSNATGLGNGVGVIVFAAANIIGGLGTGQGNVISGNSTNGINLFGPGGNTVQGNLIGLDSSGTTALPNFHGVLIGNTSTGNSIDSNVISGNSNTAVYIQGATNTTVTNNIIGLNRMATGKVGNYYGLFSSGTSNTIGGVGKGNIISGNTGHAVELNAGNNSLFGNIIGTNDSGASGLGNGGYGVHISGGKAEIIGGLSVGQGNVISANTLGGVNLAAAGSHTVQGNFIGTDMTATKAIGNGDSGVLIASPNNLVQSNVIAFNTNDGISVTGSGSDNNRILSNSIHSNTNLGIDLGDNGFTANGSAGNTGPNNYQFFPTINSVVFGSITISGTFTTTGAGSYTLEFFANNSSDVVGILSQGRTFLGSQTLVATAAGTNNFSVTLSNTFAPGRTLAITATGTGPSGTSEFSPYFLATVTTPTSSSAATNANPLAGLNNLVIFNLLNTAALAQPDTPAAQSIATAIPPSVSTLPPVTSSGSSLVDRRQESGDGRQESGEGGLKELPAPPLPSRHPLSNDPIVREESASPVIQRFAIGILIFADVEETAPPELFPTWSPEQTDPFMTSGSWNLTIEQPFMSLDGAAAVALLMLLTGDRIACRPEQRRYAAGSYF